MTPCGGRRSVLSASRARRARGPSSPALRVASRVLTDQGLTAPRAAPGRGHDRSPPPTNPPDRRRRPASSATCASSPSSAASPSSSPQTRAEASRLIDQLKRRAPEPAADRRREIRAVQDDMARGRGDAARVIEGSRRPATAVQRDLEGRPRRDRDRHRDAPRRRRPTSASSSPATPSAPASASSTASASSASCASSTTPPTGTAAATSSSASSP